MSGAATLTCSQQQPHRFGGAGSLASAAAIVLCAAAVLMWYGDYSTWRRAATPAAATRTIEPRLSGVSWAEFKAVGDSQNADGAAALRGRDHDATPTGRYRAVAVDRLLRGRAKEAVSLLEAATRIGNDSAVWSDLAAAYHEAAFRYGAPYVLGDALAAADRALAIAADDPAALFNRALILERLGLRDDAREAWSRYLRIDTTTNWAIEARAHFEALAPQPSFLDVLDGQYDRVANDPAAAASLVQTDPGSARAKALSDVLGRWADALVRGDHDGAQKHSSVARNLGAALAQRGGDRMLQAAVAAIDRTSGAQKQLLAAAHIDYRNGLNEFQGSRPVTAEPILRRAASGFEQAGHPLALAAAYFAANAMFDQGRRGEAEREYGRLLAIVPAEFPAYRAFILWQAATCHAGRAEWGAAIPLYEQSASLFGQAGETRNVAAVRRLLAFTFDRIGDRERAWEHHVTALRDLGETSTIQLEKEIATIADAAIVRRQWQVAASFLNLHVAVARRLGHDMQLASALLVRAAVRDRLSDRTGARTDIVDARVAAARVKDSSYRSLLQVQELRTTAMLASTTAAEAEALLTKSIEYTTARNDRLNVPLLLLQRARARRAAGNRAAAMSDLEDGIEELERHRGSLPPGEARWGAFHAAEELFEEAVDLATAQGDSAAAFRFSERARARALVESYGAHGPIDHTRIPADTVVVEYVALPERLVVFTADASGIDATTVNVGRELLRSDIETTVRVFRNADRVEEAAATLYRHLIERVESRLTNAKTVVFVPDVVTAGVPFSALQDGNGSHLLERHSVVVAPSAAAFVASTERTRASVADDKRLLLVPASAASDGGSALANVDDEAKLIAGAYRRVTRIAEGAAQYDELAREAPLADVIHFAGHAVGDERGYEVSSIVLRRNGKEDRVRAERIAQLKLQPSSIVILAGCGTARGERRAAEGVISVAHGFLAAGASSVIATLWPIDDAAAATFFPRVHRRLAEGMSPPEALRAAQLESLRSGDVPISLWASVQNFGI